MVTSSHPPSQSGKWANGFTLGFTISIQQIKCASKLTAKGCLTKANSIPKMFHQKLTNRDYLLDNMKNRECLIPFLWSCLQTWDCNTETSSRLRVRRVLKTRMSTWWRLVLISLCVLVTSLLCCHLHVQDIGHPVCVIWRRNCHEQPKKHWTKNKTI